MPEILPGVREYLESFLQCDSQLRAGFGGAYALDWSVVIRVSEARRIKIDDKFFTMLKAFEGEMLKEVNSDNGGK